MKIKGLRLAVLAVAICGCANAFCADYFDALFTTVKVTGKVWIIRPGETEPILAKENFRYPYGSKVVVDGIDKTLPKNVIQKNEVMVVFGSDYQIKLGMDTKISTKKIVSESGDAKVNVAIENGVVSTFITVPTTKTGDETEDAKLDARLNAFVIETPIASVSSLVDRNEIRVATDAAGVVKSKYKIESGNLNLEGQQFKVLKTRRKTEFDISGDSEFTRIDVLSGYATIRITRGEDTPYQSTFKQGALIKLWRIYTQLQKKLAVACMITLPDGKAERFEYIENPSEILKSLEGKSSAANVSADGEETVNADENTDDNWGDEESVDMTQDTTSSDTTESNAGESDATESDDFFSDSGDDFFSGDDWDF
jgi:hypothetical protein